MEKDQSISLRLGVDDDEVFVVGLKAPFPHWHEVQKGVIVNVASANSIEEFLELIGTIESECSRLREYVADNTDHLNACLSSIEDKRALTEQCESPIERMFLKELLEQGPGLATIIQPQTVEAPYRIDIALQHPNHPEVRMAIELDGHEYHKTKEQRTKDAERERYLQSNGWYVVRFTGTEVYRDVMKCAKEALTIWREQCSKTAA